MSSNNGDFSISAGVLPPTWRGNFQDFLDMMPELLSVVLNEGYSTFVSGNVVPTSNVGPWLNGKSWYVWSDDDGAYIHAEISEVFRAFYISPYDPFLLDENNPNPATTEDNAFWVKITESATPSVLGMYIHLGEWKKVGLTSDDLDEINLRLEAVTEYDENEEEYRLRDNIVKEENLHSSVFDAIRLSTLDSVYPIGTIYENSKSSLNPSVLFDWKDSTWTSFGEGRVIVGAGSGAGLTPRTNGTTFGSEERTLSQANMPDVEVGTISLRLNGSINGCGKSSGLESQYNSMGVMLGDTAYGVTTIDLGEGFSGEGESFDISQPSIVVYRWVRTA